MTDPQDAPAGPVLGPSVRRDIERLVYMADHRWRGHVDSWAQDFAEQVPVLLAEIDRLTALLSSAREEGATAERERIAREHCEDAHRQVRLNWHIDPEYERGRLHALDDLYRALQDGPS